MTVAPTHAPLADSPPRLRRRLRVMVGLLILLVLMGVNLAIASGKVRFEKVISGSMEPTLLIGDVLLMDANAVPDQYDIVVLNDPEEPGGKLVKRIIGMPGDRIVLRGGILYLNGKEEYSTQVTSNHISWEDTRFKVPEDHVFVLGDNRNNSVDSLNFGPVSYEEIRGVVSAVIWPPSRWRKPAPLHPEPAD
ncbi:MAG: Signal peptidase I U [candidate division BRC1 bacterium ADurb.BinA292]|nr:MAG: Signal peptidase I U [candidate division BRC1 bacterium ADurb.BinA292]